MTRPDVQLRPATAADCERVHAWRNHPDVRANSWSGDVIPLAEHRAWFAEMLRDSRRHLLIAEAAGVPIGVCRADFRDAHHAEVHAYLAPERIGRGLGAAMLRACVAWFRARDPHCVLEARIKPDNAASVRAFANAGFQGTPDLMVAAPQSAAAPHDGGTP